MTDYSDLHSMADAGMTLAEIAEEKGVTPDAARHAARRRSIRVTYEREIGPRERVQGMKPREAVEYLLGVIEQTQAIRAPAPQPYDAWGVGFTPLQRRVLTALFASRRCILAHEAIYSAMYFDRPDADDLPCLESVKVAIRNIRAKLPGHVRIITHTGIGYQITEAAT